MNTWTLRSRRTYSIIDSFTMRLCVLGPTTVDEASTVACSGAGRSVHDDADRGAQELDWTARADEAHPEHRPVQADRGREHARGIPSLPFGEVGDSGFGRIHGDEGIREFTRIESTAEQVMALPVNFMSFRQPKEAPSRLRSMIKQLYGDGLVAKASDWFHKLRN
jgi:hypothetical protein